MSFKPPTCPHCGWEPKEFEDYMQFVTYWGHEYGASGQMECHRCEETFHVVERVSRTYDTHKTQEETWA